VQNRNGTNELVLFYKIPKTRAWFQERVSQLRRALNSGQHSESVDWKAAEDIFGALFPRGVSGIVTTSQSLIFIPDDVLFTLPFEVFSPNASQQEFVFLKVPSTYYPSATSFRLARNASHKTSWQEGFLGLGDPINSPQDQRYDVLEAVKFSRGDSSSRAAETSENQSVPVDEPSRLRARGFRFERLPGTAIEIRNIASLLQEANEKVEIRLGSDATKNNLLNTDLSKFRFLHFATHGVLPVDTGIKEAALVLSYDGLNPAHMFFSMSEILGVRLSAESVVLSACNTGSGAISRAEGVMSLGRAFLAAGSSSVTVSLWKVADESTAEFMGKYYRSIVAGKAKNVALAEARQALFAGRYKNPFFWAPFILIGE
jgi:CHAT domain-containing protein